MKVQANLRQEAAVMLGMIQHNKANLQAEATRLGVSRQTDSVDTVEQMKLLDQAMVLKKLEEDLVHFVNNWER